MTNRPAEYGTSRMDDVVHDSEADGGCTLKGCLDMVGSVVLKPLVMPQGDGVRLANVVIAGPGETLPTSRAGLLLLVLSRVEPSAAIPMLQQAASLEYVGAVVRKLPAEHASTICDEASRLGLALLETPEETAWKHLSDLIGAALSVSSVTDVDVGAGTGDLFALANSIAGQVGGAITIEDPQGRLIAYSSLPDQVIDDRRRDAILGRHTPARAENVEEYRQIIRARGSAIRFDFPDSSNVASRVAVAVFAGGEPIGLIFALDMDPPLSKGASARLEETARLTALYLLRSRAQQDPMRWAQSEALRSLLDGLATAETVQDRLGEVSKGASAIVALSMSDHAGPVDTTKVPDMVALQCRTWSYASVVTVAGDRLYALLPMASGREVETLRRRFVRDLVEAVRRSTGISLRAAIGPVATSTSDILLSRRVADRILAALNGSTASPAIADLDDVRSQVVVRELADREGFMLDYYGSPVDRLVTHDSEHGTDYAGTLLAYLEAFGRIDVAARSLTIHENTVRYRVRRLSEIFDLTFDDPDERLVAWLRLRLRNES